MNASSVSPVPLQELFTEHEVAQCLSVSVASVRRWRLFKQGPRFLKIGACVRYRPQDVSAYLESLPTGGSNIGVAQ